MRVYGRYIVPLALGLEAALVAFGCSSASDDATVASQEDLRKHRDAGAPDGAISDSGTMRDSGTTLDSGTATDSGVTPDSGVTLDSGTTSDGATSGSCATPGPVTANHFAANANFDSNGQFVPGAVGFNVADVSSPSRASSLPAGVRALVWVGMCNGADAAFVSAMTPYVGNANVLAFSLVDEPDPTGQYHPLCTAANLKAESDWLHSHIPGSRTFITLMNFASTAAPTYANTYNPGNTGIDLYGLDPYPCRTDLGGQCAFDMIPAAVNAAIAAGIPREQLVPVYQAFGGGGYTDDSGGAYSLPTASQETQLLATWKTVLPTPVFDYVYSWGSQNGDTALAQSPLLQQVFSSHNAAACGP